MALLDIARDATSSLRSRPELFVVGSGIGLIQIVLYAILVLGSTALVPRATPFVEGVAAFGSFLLALPMFVGLYELVLHPAPDESATGALRRGLATAARQYGGVLRTDALIVVVSAVIGLFGLFSWYVAATAGRYIRYVVAEPDAPAALESVYLLVAAGSIGAVLGSYLVRFADVRTAFYGDDAVTAVARSAAACRRNLGPLGGFAAILIGIQLVSMSVLTGVMSLSLGAPSRSLSVIAGGGVVAVVVHGVAITVTGVLHATFFTAYVAPTIAGSPSPSLSFGELTSTRVQARWALAFVLVIGLVVGAAAVRSLDPGVHASSVPEPITTDDPDEAVRAAAITTAESSHRQVLYMRNASDRASSYRVFIRSGIDHRDRQTYVYFTREDGEEFGGFFGEGTMAMLRPGGRLAGLTAYERGPWSVQAIPAWGIAGGRASVENTVIPNGPSDGWQLVSATDSRIVVRMTDSDSIGDAFEARTFGGLTAPLANESHLTVTIDRERGELDDVRFHLHSKETGRNYEYRLEYRDVGSADLQRPEPIRQRRVAELVWDAIYY